MLLRFKIKKRNDNYYIEFDQGQLIAYIERAVIKYLPGILKKHIRIPTASNISQIAKQEIENYKNTIVLNLRRIALICLETAILTYMALEYFFYLWK